MGSNMQHVKERAVFEESVVKALLSAIESAFSPESDARSLKSLSPKLAEILGMPREKWPLGILRKIADYLIENIRFRKVSPVHELRWMNLLGYCLRPGYGDGADQVRLEGLWKIYKSGPAYRNNQQVKNEWWILWRRVSGGLSPGRQLQVIQDVRSIIMDKKNRPSRLHGQEKIEILMAAASMERISVKDKFRLGEFVFTHMSPKKAMPQHFWCLSRLGARKLLYGPDDRVIPAKNIVPWIEKILQTEWNNIRPAATALVSLTRKTGDRLRDVPDETASMVCKWLENHGFEDLIHPVVNVIDLKAEEQEGIFGESLPSGLVLPS